MPGPRVSGIGTDLADSRLEIKALKKAVRMLLDPTQNFEWLTPFDVNDDGYRDRK
jgi:hypothetical protein